MTNVNATRAVIVAMLAKSVKIVLRVNVAHARLPKIQKPSVLVAATVDAGNKLISRIRRNLLEYNI